jgi:transposase
MTKPLSIDLRQRVVEAIDAGLSRRAAADRFGVAVSAAIKWHALWRRTGTVAPRPQGGDRRSHRIETLAQPILALVAQTPDITLAEIAEHLERDHHERFALSVIHRFFVRHGISFKKNHPRRRAGPS